MTVCNVCTLNLRQANFQLIGDAELRAPRQPRTSPRSACRPTSATSTSATCSGSSPRATATSGCRTAAHKGLKGLKIAPFYGCQILRPSRVLGFEDPDRAVVARADHRGLRRRGGRLPGQAQVLRLPDHPGPRGDGARRARPADRAGDRGRRRRDRHAVPALPPLARRLAVEAEGHDRPRLRDADPAPLAADRGRGRARARPSSSSSATSSRSAPVLEKLERVAPMEGHSVISPEVVARYAGDAAREVDGVTADRRGRAQGDPGRRRRRSRSTLALRCGRLAARGRGGGAEQRRRLPRADDRRAARPRSTSSIEEVDGAA